ncbi:unnamed protein product [Gongylonema pulchrum]|uniref:Tektin n=1 Tax=Gongylonema pulchrum TaxID=637853 RepID=A0A183E0Y9_9BILA|nr:unnamed protein product [Gongylonema pulchrum]
MRNTGKEDSTGDRTKNWDLMEQKICSTSKQDFFTQIKHSSGSTTNLLASVNRLDSAPQGAQLELRIGISKAQEIGLELGRRVQLNLHRLQKELSLSLQLLSLRPCWKRMPEHGENDCV